MKPPINGARRGPQKTVIPKTVIAIPRVRLSNISAKTAPTTARGQAANIPDIVSNGISKRVQGNAPPQNRQSIMVWRSFAAATPTWKMENPNMDITNGNRRPFNSLRGAQNMGPRANPRTYKETPSIPTSKETWNFSATAPVAVEKILDVNAEMSDVYASITAVKSLRAPVNYLFLSSQES